MLTGDRFLYYSRRVRELRYGETRSSAGDVLTVDGRVLLEWQRRQYFIFPMLTRLDFVWTTQKFVTPVPIDLRWIHAGITHFSFGLLSNQADVFQKLSPTYVAGIARRCSGLEDVQCSPFPRDTSDTAAAFNQHVCALLQGSSNLRVIKGIDHLTSSTIRHLASYQQLSAMLIDSFTLDGVMPALPAFSFPQLNEFDIMDPEARLIHTVLPLSMPALRTVCLRDTEGIIRLCEW